jgi:hypothetical protein
MIMMALLHMDGLDKEEEGGIYFLNETRACACSVCLKKYIEYVFD